MNDRYIGITQPLNIVKDAYANIDAKYGPYDTVVEALAAIPISLRKEGLTIGILKNKDIIEHWFDGGIEDINLIQKTTNKIYFTNDYFDSYEDGILSIISTTPEINNSIITLIDSYTKENVNYEEIITLPNGNPITDSDIDNVVYRKKGNRYYVRCEFASGGTVNVRWYGAGFGNEDDAPLIQKAINKGRSVFVPTGTYNIKTSIELKQASFIGAGTNHTKFVVNADIHPFRISNGVFVNRSQAWIGNFQIMSPNSTCNNKYAIYVPGIIESTLWKPNSGLRISDIEIGGSGSFGGAIHLSSTFRVDINNVNGTAVQNPFILKGSNVQVTITNCTFNRDADINSSLPNRGLQTVAQGTYIDSSGNPIYSNYPESLKVSICSFVSYDEGINIGMTLYCILSNLDLDYCVNYGASLRGDIILQNSYIASANNSTRFIGIVADQISNNIIGYRLTITGNIIKAYRQLEATSVAIKYGLGGVSPYTETEGAVINNNKIEGGTGAWGIGIIADRVNQVTINDNVFSTGCCSLYAIQATYNKYLILLSNNAKGSVIKISLPTVSVGIAAGNVCSSFNTSEGIFNTNKFLILQ